MANKTNKTVKKTVKAVQKNVSQVTIIFAIIFLVIGLVGGYLTYGFLNQKKDEAPAETSITLIGDDVVNLNVGDTYSESGFTFVIEGVDMSNDVVIDNKVNNNEIGVYTITYTLNKDNFNFSLTRIVRVN